MLLRFALCALLMLTASFAQAEVYDLPSKGNDVIGQTIQITAKYEDTFVALARRYSVGFDELRMANPDVDPWLPGEGTKIIIPRAHILPDAPRDGIVVNLAEMRVYYFPSKADDYAGKVFTYPISIGREGWGTPLGTTTIVRKKAHPNWYPPASIRKEHAAAGDPLPSVVKSGPDNPLGEYAMYLGWPAYLMHGTNSPAGIGLRVSHGCLRMFPEDIAALFSMVGVGTKVTVVNQPYKFGWRNGTLYMQAHPPLVEKDEKGNDKERDDFTKWRKELAAMLKKHPQLQASQGRAQAIAKQATGIAEPLTTPQQAAAS